MLRLHLQRLALTCVLMAAFIGGGLLFGQPAASPSGPASASTQRPAPIGPAQAAVRDADDAEPANRARELRRSELSWPFFSFGRTRTPGSW